MKEVFMPENGKNFIPYEVDGNTIDFDDGELSFRLDKKERDNEVVLDICKDSEGSLVMGTSLGERYVAQIVIPARAYEEVEKESEDSDAEKSVERVPVPFNIDNCEIRLWELEVI
jgi:hypothetical protein